MKKETGGACGCWFGLVVIIGPILLFVCYRTAHWIYDYHMPGGHHFGGADLADLDAFVNALILGPLIGIALAIIILPPAAPPKHWIIRSIGAVALACVPLWNFAADVGKYRARDLDRQMIRKAHDDPQFRQALVTKARNGTISAGERWAVAQAVYGRDSFPEKDISFLIKYFRDDVSVVDPLLRYKGATEGDIREAYEAHKLDSGHSRISEVLVETGMAPLDILKDIAEHNFRYPHSHRYSETLIQKARDQFQRR